MTKEQYTEQLRGPERFLDALLNIVDNTEQKIQAQFVSIRINNTAQVVVEVLLHITNKLLPESSEGYFIQASDFLIAKEDDDIPVFNLIDSNQPPSPTNITPVLDDDGNQFYISEPDMWAYYWDKLLPGSFQAMIQNGLERKYSPTTATPLIFINPIPNASN